MRMHHSQLRKSKRNFDLVEPAGCNLTPTDRPSECISTPAECILTPLQFTVQKWGVSQHPIFNSVFLQLQSHRLVSSCVFGIVGEVNEVFWQSRSYWAVTLMAHVPKIQCTIHAGHILSYNTVPVFTYYGRTLLMCMHISCDSDL